MTFDLDDKTFTVVIESAQPIAVDGILARTFLDQLREFKGILPILSALAWAWNVAQNAYKYTWDTSDARQWREWIKLLPSGQTSHRIDMQHWFTMPEFTPHRRLRDAALRFIQEHGITSIEVTFK